MAPFAAVQLIPILMALFQPGPPGPPADLTVSAIRGERRVAVRCGGCHATGSAGVSPHDGAPPLREVADRYPAESLEEALAEGIMVGHDAVMPTFELPSDEIADIVAYLRTLDEGDR